MKNTRKNGWLWLGAGLLAMALSACAELPVAPDVKASDDHYLCKYFLNPYHLADGELRLDPGGPVFAKIREAQAAGTELILPFGPAEQGARARFTSGWITFRANYLPSRGMEVGVLKEVSMSPVLTWLPGDAVTWQGSDGQGRMLVKAETSARFRPAAPLRASVSCEQTTLGSPKSEPEAAPAAPPRFVSFQGDGPISVSATPGGQPEGQLVTFKEFDSPQVLEEQGASVRIRMWFYPGQLDGWIERSRTRSQKASAISAIFGGLGMLGNGTGAGRRSHARCTQPADLFVSRPGEPLRKVAQLLKHAAIVPGMHRDGFVEVTLPEVSWIVLEPGVTWALPDQELAKCASAISD